MIAISYNTRKVSPEEAPQKWADLLDPKWKDKIAVGHPAYSGFLGNWAAQTFRISSTADPLSSAWRTYTYR